LLPRSNSDRTCLGSPYRDDGAEFHAPRRRRGRATRRDTARNLGTANYATISGSGNLVTFETERVPRPDKPPRSSARRASGMFFCARSRQCTEYAGARRSLFILNSARLLPGAECTPPHRPPLPCQGARCKSGASDHNLTLSRSGRNRLTFAWALAVGEGEGARFPARHHHVRYAAIARRPAAQGKPTPHSAGRTCATPDKPPLASWGPGPLAGALAGASSDLRFPSTICSAK
jgi:hypothetical protein